jgi:hypothetical protein
MTARRKAVTKLIVTDTADEIAQLKAEVARLKAELTRRRKAGRKPIGDHPMTAAERMRRMRAARRNEW